MFANIENCKSILLPRLDTHGDHVLLTGFLNALIEKLPNAEITLLVRKSYDQLAPLYPERISWLTTSIMPYGPFRAGDETDLHRLLDFVADEKFDMFLATTYNRTWLEEIVAAKLSNSIRIAIGDPRNIPDEVMKIAVADGLNLDKPYNELIDVHQWAHETDKYQQLWNILFPDDQRILPEPKLNIDETLVKEAIDVLDALDMSPGKFIVCAPAGTQNVSYKSWSKERFAEIISWVERKYGLKALLIGHTREKKQLEEVASLVGECEGKLQIWLGNDSNFALMAAIIQQAKLYCGNDTGPLHVAAAVGTPVVGVYGGGTWPRFTPTGNASIAVAGEMECFGCYWNCVYGDGRCMQLVEVDDVKKAVMAVMQGDVAEYGRVIRTKIYNETTEDIVKRSLFMRLLRRVKNRLAGS